MIDPISTVDHAPPPATPTPAPRVVTRAVLVSGYASFVLIGWTGLLVPSLIRSIEHDFAQSDAGLGIYYFLYAVFYAAGGGAGGFLIERAGRRTTLSLASAVLAVGLALLALAPNWSLFLIASAPFGLGAGAIDAGVNGLFLELHPGRGGPLNLLHVFFSVGALVAPLALGLLVASGVSWPAIVLVTAAAALLAGRVLASVGLPAGRRTGRAAGGEQFDSGLVSLPLLLLGLGIATYVASEVGTSSWLVRFLASAPLEVATAALSLFWAGLALGRLLASRVADRFAPIPFAAACAFASGLAVIAAVLVPNVAVSIALFGLAGLAQGPVYPMIMAIGGTLQPGRSGAVSGLLTAWAVVGGLVYPPVIGFISVQAGIAAGILGAGALGLVSAVAVLGAGATSGGRGGIVPRAGKGL